MRRCIETEAVGVVRAIVLTVGLGVAAGTGTNAYTSPTDEAEAPVAMTTAAPTREARALRGIPEEAAMVLLGTMLIGIAAAVRRAA
jgi:hypothetical protein